MSVTDSLAWLSVVAESRDQRGLRRLLTPRKAHDGLLDLASNDYLRLTRHPMVTAAAADAALQWGAGATGSRLVTGSTTLHVDLESSLAGFFGAEAALVFSSGYLANLAVIPALAGRGDLVISDAQSHASLVDACRLSRASVAVAPHSDPDAVDATLARGGWRRALVVTDAVFSVDGDVAPILELHRVCRRWGALLVVDEAHALGTFGRRGRGAVEAAGLCGEPDVIITATLSKALGAQGGVIAATRTVIEHLVSAARPFVFDTALAPPAAAAAMAALGLLQREPDRVVRVRQSGKALTSALRARGLKVAGCPAAGVLSLVAGTPDRAVAAGKAVLDRGIRVGVFRPPSVPDGLSRLRFAVNSELITADVLRVAAETSAALGIRRDAPFSSSRQA